MKFNNMDKCEKIAINHNIKTLYKRKYLYKNLY